MKWIAAKIQWIFQAKDGASTILQTFMSRMSFMVLTIVTGMITARALGPEGRGELAIMGLWPQLLAFVSTLGIPAALIYNFKRHPEQRSQLFAAGLLLTLLLGGIATLIGFWGVPIWLAKNSPIVIQIAQYLILTTVFDSLITMVCASLEGLEEFSFANQIRYVIAPVCSLLGIVGLILLGWMNAVNTAIFLALIKVPIVISAVIYAWKRLNPRFQDVVHSTQCLLKYGVRSYGLDLLGTLAGKIDQIFIVGALAAYEVGIYNAALNLAGVLAMLQMSAVSVLFPKASARPVDEVVNMTVRTARVSLLITAIAAIFVGILGPYLLQFLYGQEFVAATLVFRILVLYVVLSGTVHILTQPFMALNRPEMATFLQALGLGMNLVLFMMTVPTQGIYGIVYSLLISTLFRLLAVLLSYPLVLKSNCPNLIPGKSDLQQIQRLIISNIA